MTRNKPWEMAPQQRAGVQPGDHCRCGGSTIIVYRHDPGHVEFADHQLQGGVFCGAVGGGGG